MRSLLLVFALLGAATSLAQGPPPEDDELPGLDDDLPPLDGSRETPPARAPKKELTLGALAERLAEQAGKEIVVEARLREAPLEHFGFDGVPWREQLELAARMLDDVEVEEQGEALYLVYVPRIKLRGARMQVRDALERLAKRAERKLVVREPFDGELTIDLHSVRWPDALRALAYAGKLDVELSGQAISVRPRAERPVAPEGAKAIEPGFVVDDSGPALAVVAKQELLSAVLERLGKQLGKRLRLRDPQLDRPLTLELPAAPWRKALARLAEATDLACSDAGESGIWFWPRRFLHARGVSARKLLLAAAPAVGHNLIVGAEVEGEWSVDYSGGGGAEVLIAVAEANGSQAFRVYSCDLVHVVGAPPKVDAGGKLRQPQRDERGSANWANLAQRVRAWGSLGSRPSDSFAIVDESTVHVGEFLYLGRIKVELLAVEPAALIVRAGSTESRVELPARR